MGWRWGWPALVASAALNGLLGWMVLSRHDESQASAAKATSPPETKDTPAAGSGAAAKASGPHEVAAPPSCAETLATAQKTIAKLEKLVPPSYAFEAADPHDTSQEVRIRDDVARLLGAIQHTVECRGAFCKISIVEKSGAESSKWEQPLQHDLEFRRKVRQISFHSGTPAKDPVSGEALETNDVYVGLSDNDALAGSVVLKELAARFRASSELAACKAQAQGTTGALDLKLSVDDDATSITTAAGGTLADTPVGNCIVAALGRAAGAVTLPPKVISSVLFLPIALP